VIKKKVQIYKKGNKEQRNTDEEQEEKIWARSQEYRKKEELYGTET